MPDQHDGAAAPLDHRIAPRTARHTSDLLEAFLAGATAGRVEFGALVDALGDRAFGALLVVFALPNVLPVAFPGMSSILGVPLILLSAQLMVGQPEPRLPRWLTARSMRREDFERLVLRLLPYLRKAERAVRPRWLVLTAGPAERAIGGICLVLSVVLALPLPLGNILPAAAITILAMGLVERDGIMILAGTLVALFSLAVVAAVVLAIIEAAFFFLARALS